MGHQTAFAGEVGLSGEIRPVARVEQRILEASRMGFEQIVISGYHRNVKEQNGLKIRSVVKIEGLVRLTILLISNTAACTDSSDFFLLPGRSQAQY